MFQGVIFGSGESWKEIRRFTIRSLHEFGFGHLKTMERFLGEELEEVMLDFGAYVEKGPDVCLRNRFNLPALNLIWRAMCGARCSRNEAEMQKLISIVSEVSLIASIGTQPFFAFPFLCSIPGATNYQPIVRLFRKLQQFFKV
jgi:hypothetical protein